MEKLLQENSCKRLIKELVQGKDFATQLQILLQRPIKAHGPVSADELVLKIWRSFTQAITELNTLGNSKSLVQIGEVDQADSGDRKSKDSSSEMMKKEKIGAKDRRGCYKRRKTSGSWMRESATMDDGCAWRKYGQKIILNSKYPRSYFRCSHKYDQDCRATKQVQTVQENPIMYHTTYFGNHTCNSLKIPKHKRITNYSQFNHPIVESLHEVTPKLPSSDTHDHSTVEEGDESKLGQSDDASSTMDSNLWQDFMPSSPSAHDSTLADLSSSFFEQVISNDMEYFAKFDDLHFEVI